LELVPELQSQASVLLFTLKKGIGKTASPSKLPTYMFSKKPGTKFSASLQLTPTAGCINSLRTLNHKIPVTHEYSLFPSCN
jgi:hypothetical protein